MLVAPTKTLRIWTKGNTMFRLRLARTVLVYLVVKYLRWKLSRFTRVSVKRDTIIDAVFHVSRPLRT
ncbi:MAG TPA: hypothetical protein VN890_03695 [Methylocella sp.]|nr:hypothetical protein [Methylocella sp.]